MAQPCEGSTARILRMRRSRVPWRRSRGSDIVHLSDVDTTSSCCRMSTTQEGFRELREGCAVPAELWGWWGRETPHLHAGLSTTVPCGHYERNNRCEANA